MDVTQLVILSVVPFIVGFFIAWSIWGKYKEKINGMQKEIRQLNLSIDQMKKELEDGQQAIYDREGQLAMLRGQLKEKAHQLSSLEDQIRQNKTAAISEIGAAESSQKHDEDKSVGGDALLVKKSDDVPVKNDTQNLVKPKKRGRPPKAGDGLLSKETVKRGPGRPKKQQHDSADTKPKRRGRPPKAKGVESAQKAVKRGPGRPKKARDVEVEPIKPKRRGRPPKSSINS